MKKGSISRILILALLAWANANAKQVAYFPFEINAGRITETVSGTSLEINGNFMPENVAGVKGNALRLDGYSSYAEGQINDIINNSKKCTVSIWIAPETYPIVEIDRQTTEKTAVADCLDPDKKSGFAFKVGFDGNFSFSTYISGWLYTLDSSEKLPEGEWSHLTATLDAEKNSAKLYLNGKIVAESRCNGEINILSGNLLIGRSASERYHGPFCLTSFNGLIDELSIWDEVLGESAIKEMSAENTADFSIPASRFANDPLRPRFHGMPGANWTNESHGMYYSNGRYHLFFQKNANGPFMARLHWGHISSENLYDWREEPIAIRPAESYDIKGCWSGTVFSDEEVSEGKPCIIYTGVDYGRAVIARADAEDNDLIRWKKNDNNPIIDGRPSGLSDDFRDPWFFRANGKAYIIVGSSKNGVGTTTLHEYNPADKKWSNDGRLFFTGRNESQTGSFWEMPNVTDMGNGNFLFTSTPIGSSLGTRTIYSIGEINNQGQFLPRSNSFRNLELFAGDGFGLLSPTIMKHDGKTILLGIVPDKLPGEINHQLGWAHTYSLPREISLGDNGELIQKPLENLKNLRSPISYYASDFNLDGEVALNPISGRKAEISASFSIGNAPFGIKFFKNESGEGRITYYPVSGELELDVTELNRHINDRGSFNGIYSCSLPELLPQGSTLKLNIFIDGSILDIFVNDRWASSVRVFPTDSDANGLSLFAEEGAVNVKEAKAWNLESGQTPGSLGEFLDDAYAPDKRVDVYTITGIRLKKDVLQEEATLGLPKGIYIIGNRKHIISN